MDDSTHGFNIFIGKNRVIVVTGTKTQTVNICTASNKRGTYQATYRLPIASAVVESDLTSVGSLTALREWLEINDGELIIKPAGAASSKLVDRIAAPTLSDPWVCQAVIAAEMAMTYLVEEFLEQPYLHRREHSLHARLFGLLADQWIFSKSYRLGTTTHRTQLIHKEWPETIPDAGSHRGAFDLAILAPQQLEHATLTHFRQGRIDAPIVIEIGLDYGYWHLKQDHKKLIQSEIVAPYLIDFSRINSRDPKTEDLVVNPTAPIRTAYVHHSSTGTPVAKQLSDANLPAVTAQPRIA